MRVEKWPKMHDRRKNSNRHYEQIIFRFEQKIKSNKNTALSNFKRCKYLCKHFTGNVCILGVTRTTHFKTGVNCSISKHCCILLRFMSVYTAVAVNGPRLEY